MSVNKEAHMTASAYLRPTAIQKIRAFFDETGQRVPPWASYDELLDGLWATLYERRGEKKFWDDRAVLLASLDGGNAGGGLPCPEAELLGGEKADAILRELRSALDRCGSGERKGAMRRFAGGLRAPLLGCVLLMGAAVAPGCGGALTSQAAGTLNGLVNGADSLSDDEKASLKSCFAGLSTAQQESLVQLFKTKSEEEIAAELEAMLEPEGLCYKPPADAGTDDAAAAETADSAEAPPEAAEEDEGSNFDPVPVYKGVVF
jgi:hypothetical protein